VSIQPRSAGVAIRLRLCLLGLYALFVTVWATLSSLVKPFHFDELCSWYVARQPSVREMWQALAAGADVNPIGFYVITRFFDDLVSPAAIGHRTPAIIGFLLMGLGLFVLAERRGGPAAGAIAALVPFSTFAVTYAYEARPYGLVLGCTSMALLCYVSAVERRARPVALAGFVVFLAVALSSHYYAALLIPLFGAAEVARSARSHRADLAVWACLAIVCIPLAFHAPLIRALSIYSGRFWEVARPSDLLFIYLDLTRSRLLVIVVIGFVLWRWTARGAGERLTVLFERADVLAALALTAFPAAAVVGGLVANGFTARYALPGVVGIAATLGLLAGNVWRERPAAAVALATLLALTPVGLMLEAVGSSLGGNVPPSVPESIVRRTESLPVVVASSHDFFQLAHYAPPALQSRLVYVADPDRASAILGIYTDDRVLLGFAGRTPIRIERYESFISRNPQFLLYVPSWGAKVWIDWQLIKDGADIRLVDVEEGHLYLVSLGAPQTG
jgi:hypothetical protein